MCGICGVVDPERRLEAIVAINGAQAHRGPDDEGYLFVNTGTSETVAAGGSDTVASLRLPAHHSVETSRYDLALANRRLAILDTTAAGHMPMSYDGGALWVTYNGEIYNYRELRAELTHAGRSFSSNADTEVLLAAYAQWGPDCLNRLNGMFAFALWDGRRRELFCARDRCGVKPFYYYWNRRTFVFASELKALLFHPSVPRTPNDGKVFDYLALDLSDHDNETFFEDILSLRAGHFLVFRPQSSQITVSQWWNVPLTADASSPDARREAGVYQEFAHLLEDAVRLRLRSDVPVGSCLSGGLDSSAIVCLANNVLKRERVHEPVHQNVFTARYELDAADEYRYSSLVVRQTGANEHIVFPSPEGLWNDFDRFVWQMDEPVGSTSQYAQWCVMRLAAAAEVPVLLDGQGGDEVLAGYYDYYLPYISETRQTQGTTAAIAAAWNAVRIGGAPVRRLLFENVLHRLPGPLQRPAALFVPASWRTDDATGVKLWQLNEAFSARCADRHWRPFTKVGPGGLTGVLLKELTSTNLPKLLRYEDRNSMAFSREARLPFLDFRVIEMMFRLPLPYRIRGGWTKWILRRSLESVLPAQICWRRSKLGFPTPERRWLRHGAARIQQLFRQEQPTPHLDRYVRRDLLHQLSLAPVDALMHTPGIWRLANLIRWMDLFCDAGLRVPAVNTPDAA